MSESQEEHGTVPEQGWPKICALYGYTCPFCRTVCDLEHYDERGGDLHWPIGTDHPVKEVALICGDCFDKYFDISEDFLDAAAKQVVERQKERRQTSPPYDETRKQALERDEHTCQLCGEEGYPKTELGLGVFPVEAENYHLKNLVTVCDDCFDQDAERLRIEAAQAKKWINAEQEKSDESDETGTNGERV